MALIQYFSRFEGRIQTTAVKIDLIVGAAKQSEIPAVQLRFKAKLCQKW